MGKLFVSLLLLILPVQLFSQLKSGYEIDITLDGLADSTIFLAYHLGDKQYIRDTIRLDMSGHSVIRGDEALPQGIYMIVLPDRKYFEVLISKDQNFSLRCVYNDYFNTLRFSGSDENSAFLAYQKKWMGMQQRDADLGKRAQNNRQNSDSVKILVAEQKAQESNMIAYLKEVIAENNGNLLALLVKAMLPPVKSPFLIFRRL